MDPSKLKVVELRAELAARGLDSKGVKAVLIERLNASLHEDDGGQVSEESSEPPEEILPDAPDNQSSPKAEYEFDVESNHENEEGPIPVDDDEDEDEEIEEKNKLEEPTNLIKEVEPIQQKEVLDEVIETKMEDTTIFDCSSSVEEKEDDNESNDSVKQEEVKDENIISTDQSNEMPDEEKKIKLDSENDIKEDEMEEDDKMDGIKNEEEKDIVKTDVDKNEDRETKTDSEKDSRDTSDRRRRSNDDRRRKRQRSGSPQQRRDRRSPPRNAPVLNSDDFAIEEDEPVLDEKSVTLSWYDSDLNLKIHTDDFLSARPLSDVALGFVWAGARSTHGIKEGRILYEIQIVGENNFSTSFPEENNVHELMCGWSTISTSLHLGESPMSFGYSGLGKKCVNNEFTDYGCKIELSDIIGVYLDLDSSPCTIEYTVNGISQGIAFEFDKTELAEDALFPHIMSKNVGYKVNFGQYETFLKRVKPKSSKVITPKKDSRSSDKKETKIESENKISEDNVEKVEESKEENTEEDSKEEEIKEEEIKEDEIKEEEIKEGDTKVEDEVTEKHDDVTAEEDVVMCEVPLETNLKEDVTEEEPIDADNKTEEENVIEDKEEAIELSLLPDYIYICKVPEESLVPGPRRPDTRQDCEVILLVGLPGSGKTYWALNHVKENHDKRYNILGTQTLLERMRFSGENKSKFVGRWEKLIEWCTRSIIVLQELACKRRRNYILDQTNVYASAQRRKMRGFGEFKRIAVIIIPEDEEYKQRYDKKIEIEGKEIPDVAVNEMKANFALPSIEFGWFTEVRFTELDGEAAKTTVNEYNEKGRAALPAQQPSKRRRYNERDNRRDNNRNNNRDQRHHQQRWNGPMDRRGGRGDRWGPPGPAPGGWRGGFDRRDRVPWGGGAPGNWMPNKRGPRFEDRGYRGPPPPMGGRNDRDRRDFRGGDRGPPRGPGRNGRDDKKGPKDLMSKSSSGGDSRNGSKSYSSGSQGNWGQASNWSGGSSSNQGQYGNWGGYGQNYNQGWGNNWNQGGSSSGGYGSQWANQTSSNTQNSGSGSSSGQWKNYGTSQSQSSTGSSSANNNTQSTQQQQQLQQQQWMNWWQQQQQQQQGGGGNSSSGSGTGSSNTNNNQSDANIAAWQNWAQYAQAYYSNAAGSQTNPKSQSIDSNNKK